MKGMSKVLTLIVAASVLLMTAVTVIFLTSGSLGSFGGSLNSEGCKSAIQQQCRIKDPRVNDDGIAHIDAPSECIAENAEGEKEWVDKNLEAPLYGVGEDFVVDCMSVE